MNGTEYEAQVRATNGVGQQGTWSPSGTVTPTAAVPDQVQTVALSNVATGIRAAWGVPDDNGDALDGYRAQIANNSSFTAASTAVVTATSHTFTAVNDGTTYWVRVRAYNGEGNGDWSPGVSLTRDDGVAVPDAPDVPEATPRRPLIVDWAFAPGDDNGEAADEYQLQWRYAGSNWSGNVIDSDEPCARHSVDDDTTAVESRARSHNGDGWGTWSPTGSVAAADLLDEFGFYTETDLPVTIPAGVTHVVYSLRSVSGTTTLRLDGVDVVTAFSGQTQSGIVDVTTGAVLTATQTSGFTLVLAPQP